VVLRAPEQPWRSVGATAGRFVDYFAEMSADLALLLATLSVMTGAPDEDQLAAHHCWRVDLAARGIDAFWFGALSAPDCRRRRRISSPR